MKTAIQTLIDELDASEKSGAFNETYSWALREVKKRATELLSIEKEQHKDTFLQGVLTGRRRPDKDGSYEPDFNHYFITQT